MKRSAEAAIVFQKVYKGNMNFITPTILAMLETEKFYVELSCGKGIFTRWIYGVTVLDKDGTERPDLNEAFSTKQEALEYIKKLDSIE